MKTIAEIPELPGLKPREEQASGQPEALMNRILIVEDDAQVREMLRDLLGGRFAVRAVETAEEGLLACAAARPDLILLDLALPGMDGLELMRRLLGHDDTRRVPILVFTALELGWGELSRLRALPNCLRVLDKLRGLQLVLSSALGACSRLQEAS